MRRMLITGASGFIGEVMCKAAARAGFHVVAMYRVMPQFLEKTEHLERRQINTSDDAQWQQALAGCDSVIHLAGRAHRVGEQLYEALEDHRAVNTQETLKLARLAVKAGVKRFIFVSSIGVNGMMTEPGRAFREDDTPSPQSAYALSKLEAELGLKAIAKESGIEIVIVRPPLVYGENAPGNFNQLVRWVACGVPLPFAAIKNQRSFIGLDNLVDFLLTCVTHPQAAQETFLVSDGEDLSTPELVRRIAASMHKKPHLWPFPSRLIELGANFVGRPSAGKALCSSLCIDASKAHRLLQWQAPVTLSEGLHRAVQTYRR